MKNYRTYVLAFAILASVPFLASRVAAAAAAAADMTGVMMKNGKMMMVKDGKAAGAMDHEMKMPDGQTVMPDGSVKLQMKEGQMMMMDGMMMECGKAMAGGKPMAGGMGMMGGKVTMGDEGMECVKPVAMNEMKKMEGEHK